MKSTFALIIGVLVVSAFVMILNETIVSVALPDLARELAVTASTVQWLMSGFLLTMAVVIPTTGYLIERLAPRRIYLAAMTLFCVGTLVSALAPSFGVLLAGRVVQAGGTAVMLLSESCRRQGAASATGASAAAARSTVAG